MRPALTILAASSIAAWLVTQPAPAASGVSYTSDQAALGAKTFAANCAQCHGANLEGVSAPALKGKVSGISQQSVGELFEYVSQQMPLTKPGALSSNQYVDIVAYLLQANGRRAGSGKLSVAMAKTATATVRP